MELVEERVGIADFKITKSPNKLITVGLGSCIGISLYDNKMKIGGLLHIMLPDSQQFSNVTNPLKFADLGIPILVKSMQQKGSKITDMTAKIAGGASMFKFSDKSLITDIGKRNSEAVISALNKLSIPILSKDIGGNKGRTMIFDTLDGSVKIRIPGIGVKTI